MPPNFSLRRALRKHLEAAVPQHHLSGSPRCRLGPARCAARWARGEGRRGIQLLFCREQPPISPQARQPASPPARQPSGPPARQPSGPPARRPCARRDAAGAGRRCCEAGGPRRLRRPAAGHDLFCHCSWVSKTGFSKTN